MNNFKNRQSSEILGSVYKNADMAYDSSGEVLKRCKNMRLYNEISAQRERYRSVAAEARGEIVRRGGTPHAYPPHTKAMARMGISMRTMADPSSQNIASLMIRGTTMGIIDMQHAVNRSRAAEPKIRDDAEELLRREQSYCESLKRYL